MFLINFDGKNYIKQIDLRCIKICIFKKFSMQLMIIILLINTIM